MFCFVFAVVVVFVCLFLNYLKTFFLICGRLFGSVYCVTTICVCVWRERERERDREGENKKNSN